MYFYINFLLKNIQFKKRYFAPIWVILKTATYILLPTYNHIHFLTINLFQIMIFLKLFKKCQKMLLNFSYMSTKKNYRFQSTNKILLILLSINAMKMRVFVIYICSLLHLITIEVIKVMGKILELICNYIFNE